MKTYHTDIISDFFLASANPEFGDVLSNLKVQKLCYYAAGLISAVRPEGGAPLFQDSIEAWQHGPVVPSQYYRFKEYGSGDISPVEGFDFDIFDPEDLRVLNDVYNFYGQYSAWKLRNMTHEEAPWLNAYARQNRTITPNELRAYFLTEIDQDYIAEYEAAQQVQQEALPAGI